MSHPATSCFNEFYFEPLEIRSLLDVAVLNAGKLTAVLCCEHCEDIRNWTEEDIAYVRSMATVLSLTFRYKSTAA
jgi:GAF domain-containing protein